MVNAQDEREIKAEQRNFHQIFYRNKYRIPKFQREYSWTTEQVRSFYDAVMENYKKEYQYFFGPLVFVSIDQRPLKVVDGQQRLTTASLFIAAISDILYELDERHLAETNYESIMIDEEPKITVSQRNTGLYGKLMLLQSAELKLKSIKRHSTEETNKKMYSCYKFFADSLKKLIKKEEDPIRILKDLLKEFKEKFILVSITVPSESRAYKIFITLNNEGLELAASDLVKSYLLGVIDDDNGNVDDAYRKWNSLLDELEGIDIDTFLKDYWVAFVENIKSYDTIFPNIIENYKNGKDCMVLLETLYENSKIYRQFLKPTDADWGPSRKKTYYYLMAIKNLGIKNCWPILLVGFEKYGENPKDFEKLVEYCLKFFVRARTICGAHPTDLGTLSANISEKIRGGQSNVNDVKKMLKEDQNYPKKSLFLNKFNDNRPGPRTASYILSEINQQKYHKGKSDLGPLLASDKSAEHIMPKDITKWDDYIGKHLGIKKNTNEDIYFQRIDAYHENYLKLYGNYTLLNRKKNSAIQNKPFKEKCKVYKKSEAKITKALAKDYKHWYDSDIIKRTESLGKQAEEIWSL